MDQKMWQYYFHQELFEMLFIKPVQDSGFDFYDPKQPYQASKYICTLDFNLSKTLISANINSLI